MYQVLYAGFDTLDIAFEATLPQETLDLLEQARTQAEANQKDEPVTIGRAQEKFLIKPHGQRGGFRYIVTNGPTGAIFSIKKNATNPNDWNLFVSVRALCLLTKGYDGTKAWLHDTLAAMGFTVKSHSVNRLDYAVDILAPDFRLDPNCFVTPAQSKVGMFWSKDTLLDDDGNKAQAVMRGHNFESVTIGKMPNRQVIVYDKRRASIDLKTPYWFEAWGINKDDPGAKVWRVEIRAGKGVFEKKLLKRPLSAIEAIFGDYLRDTAHQVRYVTARDEISNVTRAKPHPLWQVLSEHLAELPESSEPVLPEARALEILRQQRSEMALKQAFGNLLNALVLSGMPPEQVANNFPAQAEVAAGSYTKDLGHAMLEKKVKEVSIRLSPLFSRER
jgi:hypothetical protein